MRRPVGVKGILASCCSRSLFFVARSPLSFQRDPAAPHGPENFLQRFRVRTDSLLQLYPACFVRNAVPAVAIPRSNPMVSLCCEIFLLRFVAAVLTFFIAGLLFICASSTSITWERTPYPVRSPAFSSHLVSSTEVDGVPYNRHHAGLGFRIGAATIQFLKGLGAAVVFIAVYRYWRWLPQPHSF